MSLFQGGRARALVVLGLLELAFLAAAGWWPEAGVPFPRLALLAGAFAAYWAVAFTAFDERADTRVIWGFAILFRLVLLPCAPFLSDDIYRYLWDGHVQLEGINPYLYPPDAPELESVRTAWHARINNPSIPTIYPPFAQMVFAAGALAGGSVVALKALWTLADLGACLLLAAVARRTGRSVPATLILFAWSPLMVVETAWSGHFEALGILLLAILLLFAVPARGIGSAGISPDEAGARQVSGAGADPVSRAPDARAAGAIRRDLEARGRPIGPYDVLIAGQARARELVLVTANTREFERVDGLRLEDWTTPLSEG